MYYQARVYQTRQVASAQEAAELIKGGKSQWNEALQWQGKEHPFLCVADGHLDNMLSEVAILRKEKDNSYTQVESITAAWVDSVERLTKLFIEAETSDFNDRTQLILDAPKGHEEAWFTCSCCGESFKGNVKEQLQFDQDAGYGMCNECR